MKFRKITSIILAIVLTLTMGVTAFAADEEVKTEISMPNGATYAANEYDADTADEEKLWSGDGDEFTDENGVTWRYIHGRNYIVSEDDSNYLYKVREDNTLSIIYDYLRNDPTGEIIIPDTLDGKSVTKIDALAFFACNDITGIRIPDTVKEIGYLAFAYCTKLERIVFGKSIAKVSADAFGNINREFEICFVGSEAAADEIVVWSYNNKYTKTVFNWSNLNRGSTVSYDVDVTTLTETTTELTLAEWFRQYFKELFEMIVDYYKTLFAETGTTLEHWFGGATAE